MLRCLYPGAAPFDILVNRALVKQGKIVGGILDCQRRSTAIGEALETTMAAFDAVPDCTRHLIDLSGDGISKEGVEPSRLRRELRARGITVNAIAIEESEPDLTAYFFENVIVGDGAFVVTAAGFRDYPERIRKKLLREVTQQTARLHRTDERFVITLSSR